MGLKLSILDQTVIGKHETASAAFRHTLELAQRAEQLGYYRFWVSEHHDTLEVAGSSPEVLIAHLLAKTEHIRIGSGGVMLQHYSPYKVAENFNVLSALAPGRVDLGIGRAPGGLPRSTRALQQSKPGEAPRTLAEKLTELQQHLAGSLPEEHPLHGVRATPLTEAPAPLYLLGASSSSAGLAAELGIPYVFAQFINGDEEAADQALGTYRDQFRQTAEGLPAPQAILAVSVIVAETDEAARALAADVKSVKIHLESGRTITVKTLEHAEEFGRQTEEKFTIEVKEARIVHGSKATVRAKLIGLAESYGLEELIVTAPVPRFEDRLRVFELLQEAFAEQTV
ncbi:LLM class flavin-dependent oxidoreductase [Paenibacillus puerhi]|uniref:LLM class flavin-dependent oxidoreductase n=1 Tax=Paenibacillus puerhi TaxID=2692622 RepID=UPI001357434E|nr:LLM class flavin-dependent oxidoreductase [Paenibacillus puerhi]